jgi:hypothetical protein
VIARRLSRGQARALALFFAIIPAVAQTDPNTPTSEPNNYPPALPARRGAAPALVFEKIGEIPLPGPVLARGAWVDGGLVVIPVKSGVASVAPEVGATPSVSPAADVPPRPEWVVAPDGKRRYRTSPGGVVQSEKRRRPDKPWKRSWKIVTGSSIEAPPVLLGPRLCFSGRDDRVTCVRASNGHRLWAVDLGDRLSRPLACWPVCEHPPDDALLLAVPDDGATVIALDAYDGKRIATFELPAHHRFAGSALVVSKDRIAVASKGYDEGEAALVLLRLVAPPPAAPPKPPAL